MKRNVISNAVRNLLTIFARNFREEISPPRQKAWRVVEMTCCSNCITTFAMIFILFFVLFIRPVMAGDLSSFAQANTQYQSGDFKGALTAYEGVLNSAKETAALDYNLGNVHFRLGHRGKALLYYERALRILPRNGDIRWNIELVKSAAVDRLDPVDEGLTVMWIKKFASQWSINEIAMILSGLLILFMLTTFAFLVFPVLKPVFRGLGALTVFIFLTVSVLFVVKWIEVKDPRVVITDKEVEARYGPSDKETKAFTLHEGAEARVIDESKDWYYAALENKSLGWIPKKSCEVI
ncbi:MAG: hypothetical protein COT00_05275 [Candidatus Omnitrophica bacterium CG07_land_8_20_14_0_80_50_8]|nr:MAG: hypothetical protein COT00_05275 [Candidatus Omnitrophica bacterium CG07_land_8_20_14_0_80_50_8]